MNLLPTVGCGVDGCVGMTTWLICSLMAWNQMKSRLILPTAMTTIPWAVTMTSPTMLSEERYGKWSEQFDKKGHIAAAHRRFRWRQCAPRLIHASWTHLSPHPKRHHDWFSRFFTDHSRKSLYFTMGHLFPLKIAHAHVGSGHPLSNLCAHPSAQMASQSGQQCLQGLQA